MELGDMRSTAILAVVVMFALVVSTPWACADNPTQLQNVSISRTLYIGPAYQVYIDDVALAEPSDTYNITFLVTSPGVIFDVRAYGPQNQSLAVAQVQHLTNNTFNGELTMTIGTSGFTTFRLVTIVQGMTYNLGNFTTLINFFPLTDQAVNASTTIYLPLRSSLISYSLATLSNSTEGARPMVYGTALIEPSNATIYGIVTFSGNFSTVVAEDLQRTIRVYPDSVEFSETVTLVNTATTSFSTVLLDVPAGATGIAAMDTIGLLGSSVSGNLVRVTLRGTIDQNEKVQITLVYSLPTSIIGTEGGRSVISGNVLPDFLNMPCGHVNITVIMPTWSTSPQMAGGQVVERYYGPVANAAFSTLTPYTNQIFSASYVPPPLTTQTVSIIAAIALIMAILAVLLIRWRFFSGKAGAPTAPSQAQTPKQAKKEKP